MQYSEEEDAEWNRMDPPVRTQHITHTHTPLPATRYSGLITLNPSYIAALVTVPPQIAYLLRCLYITPTKYTLQSTSTELN